MRVFLITLPKSGTYLLSAVMERLGFSQSYMHISEDKYELYDPDNISDSVLKPSAYRHYMPFSRSLDLVSEGGVAVGHIPYSVESEFLLDGFKKVLLLRDYDEISESAKRFRDDRRRRVVSLDSEFLDSIKRWEDCSDVHVVFFSDLLQRNLLSLDELQRFLFNDVLYDSEKVIRRSLGADTLTKSNYRKYGFVVNFIVRAAGAGKRKLYRFVGRSLKQFRMLLRLEQIYSAVSKLEGVVVSSEMRGLSRTKERQVAKSLSEIRKDHLGRYKFASGYVKSGDQVCDLGCGIGYGGFVLSVSSMAKSVVSVDKSLESIEFASCTWSSRNLRYLCIDIFDLDRYFEVSTFDVVVCFEVIEHVEAAVDLLHIIFASMKPGALLVVSTPNENRLQYSSDRFPFHYRHYTPCSFTLLLESVGFVNIEISSQHSRCEEEVLKNSEGLYLIAVASKPQS